MTPLENSLILSYLHSKMSVKNLEIAVHELSVLNHDDAGKLQHRFEKLINAHRNAMQTMERNIENKELLESDFEEQLDNNWNELLGK
jgi:Skp family chaperone for outer membrane proteins